MGLTVIIEESKIEEASHMAEKMLHYGGRLMSCIEDMRRGGERMNHRMIDYNQPREHHPNPYGMEKMWQHPHMMHEVNYRHGGYGTHNYDEGYEHRGGYDEMNERRGMGYGTPYGRFKG